jgi:hypothetical protein
MKLGGRLGIATELSGDSAANEIGLASCSDFLQDEVCLNSPTFRLRTVMASNIYQVERAPSQT